MLRTKRLSWRKVDPLLVPTVIIRIAAINQTQSVAVPGSTEAYLQQLDDVLDHNAFQPRPFGSDSTNSIFDDRRRVVITRDNSSS